MLLKKRHNGKCWLLQSLSYQQLIESDPNYDYLKVFYNRIQTLIKFDLAKGSIDQMIKN